MFVKMSLSTSSLRSQVLNMYRKTLRLSKTWEAKDPHNTGEERKYILNEAKTLFRRNKNVGSTVCHSMLIKVINFLFYLGISATQHYIS